MSKRFLLTLVAAVLLLAGIFWFTKKDAASPDGSSAGQLTNHVQGEGTSGVTLVEYGDFQCPACGGYYPIIEQVQEKYGDKLKFQFRNFPLTQIHPNAMAAHRAAEAAEKQGKFWEMYDLLYQNQQQWSQSTSINATLEAYATQLSLNIDQFKQDFSSPATNSTVNADIQEGQKLGVNSTPTFFLNGKKLEEPPRDVEGFSKIIDEAAQASDDTNQ